MERTRFGAGRVSKMLSRGHEIMLLRPSVAFWRPEPAQHPIIIFAFKFDIGVFSMSDVPIVLTSKFQCWDFLGYGPRSPMQTEFLSGTQLFISHRVYKTGP
jgi:hypothetical protein